MQKSKIKIDRNEILLFLGIIFLFFLLRLVNLTILPVFADEAIYIRWAQVMRNEPTLRFLPLSDGKQPLWMWAAMIVLRFFSDPLFGGRVISVFSGFGSLVGIFVLTHFLFRDKRVAFLAGLFYAVVPFFVFFDRMALVDSMLLMWGIWFFILAVLLVRFLRLDLAMMAGIVLGAALVTKSPALFFAILLPTTGFLTVGIDLKKRKKAALQLIKLGGLWLVIYLFGFGIYNLLRLGPNFAMIGIRNKDYVFSIREVLSHFHDPLIPHFNDLREWLPNLFTWPLFFFSIVGLILGLLKKSWRQQTLFLFLVSFVPFLVQSMLARVFTPRYILFASWPMLLLAAVGAGAMIKRAGWAPGLMIILLIFPLSYNCRLLTNPKQAPLPRRMRSGYLEEWSSGYGIREVVEFVRNRLSETDSNLLVGTEGYFGTLPDGLQIYFDQNPRVLVLGVGQPVREVPRSLLEATINNEVYLVVNESRMLVSADPKLTLVEKYPKAIGPSGQDFLLLYQVKNE